MGGSREAGQPGVCSSPPTSWFCGNKLQGQSQRENEVTKYAAGRERREGGRVMPAPLGMANAGTGGRQRLHGTLTGPQAVRGRWGPRNGREKMGGELRLRIEI